MVGLHTKEMIGENYSRGASILPSLEIPYFCGKGQERLQEMATGSVGRSWAMAGYLGLSIKCAPLMPVLYTGTDSTPFENFFKDYNHVQLYGQVVNGGCDAVPDVSG